MAALTPASVFRRFVTDGVPSSGNHKPQKSEIIQLLNLFFGTSRGGWVVTGTKAELDGVTPENETDGGVVLDDPTASNNGYYQRDASAWVRERGFPDTFARVTLSGTANAQTGTVSAGVNPGDIEVFIAFVTTPNTGPMTLSVDGETARDVVNAAGNALSAGEWTGIVLYVLNDDGDYQLIIDAGAAASAAQSASEAAADADRSEAARDVALGAVPNVYSPTRTALKALDTNTITEAYLTESGREGQFIWRTGDYTAQVAADTLEGIYIASDADPTGATGAWVRQGAWAVEGADVLWWGANLDDVADDTEAFNVALAVAKKVLFPEGRAYVTDMIQVPNNGSLIGVGVGRSVFSVKSGFNLSAEAVVKMGTSENMSFIDQIGFEFEQPASDLRADMIQYPYAVGHRNIPRVRIGHIRISRGWNGVDASQNAGGATYDWIECGTLNTGLAIDGALDTMNIGRFRHWPFGMSGSTGVGLVYRDGNNYAAKIGRCDGLEGEIHSFLGIVDFIGTGVGSAGRHLHALHLDGDGSRLRVVDGPLDIDYVYATKTSAHTQTTILLEAGTPSVRIADLDIRTSQISQPPILVNAGALSINGGRLDARELGQYAALAQNSARLYLRNMELSAAGARTVAYIRNGSASAQVTVQNCDFLAGIGTGIGLQNGSSGEFHAGGTPLHGRTVSGTITPA